MHPSSDIMGSIKPISAKSPIASSEFGSSLLSTLVATSDLSALNDRSFLMTYNTILRCSFVISDMAYSHPKNIN